MPGYNGMGPAGQGPLTGRGMGYCVSELAVPERQIVYGIGRGGIPRGGGRGQAFGNGRAYRNRFFFQRAPTRQEILGSLKLQRDGLDSRIKDLESKI